MSSEDPEAPQLEALVQSVRSKIGSVLEEFFSSDGMQEITQEIERGDIASAVVIAKSALLDGRVDPSELCKRLQALDANGLAPEVKLEVLDLIVGTSVLSYNFAGVLKEVGELQQLIEEPTKLRNLSVIKARGLLQKGNIEAASVINERLVEDPQCEADFRAWALQGLAEARRGAPQSIDLHERAGDAFLEAGKATQAVNNYLIAARALRHKDPDRAITLVDRATPLFDESNQAQLASLLHSRTELLRSMGRFSDAMTSAQRALELRKSIANDESRAASLHLLSQVADELGDESGAEEYANQASALEATFDKAGSLHLRTLEACQSGDSAKVHTAREEALEKGDVHIVAMCEIWLAVEGKGPIEDRVSSAEDARRRIRQEWLQDRDEALVEMALGELYRQHGDKEKAARAYLRVHQLTPENADTARIAIRLLFDVKRWHELVEVARVQLKLVGDRADLWGALGQALLALGSAESVAALLKARRLAEPEQQATLDNLIAKAVELPPEPPPVSTVAQRRATTLRDLEINLLDFKHHVEADRRMGFWVRADKKKETAEPTLAPDIAESRGSDAEDAHVWVPNPESRAKDIAWGFLAGRLPGVEILEEVPAGCGRIDLYVRLEGGERVVIELKMLGDGYSSTYAEEGFDQLCAYMDAKKTRVGYLLAFDARLRDQAKELFQAAETKERAISVVLIDVRTTRALEKAKKAEAKKAEAEAKKAEAKAKKAEAKAKNTAHTSKDGTN
jgi:tetratricopeptide (TPR) repeat protein